MSDETTTTAAPSAEPVQSATPAPAPGESTQTPAPEAAETQKPETSEDGAEPKHELPRGVQRRIDRLTRDKYRLQAELEMARKQAPQEQQKPTAPAAEGAPKPDQFKSYEEYLEARADWRAEQKVSKMVGELQQNAQREAGKAEQERLIKGLQKQFDEATGVYDDFEEVALSPEVPISEPVYAAILRSPKGADVAYYLGKNPEKAAQIAGLDPIAAAVRIGEIGATVTRPTAKKTTSAPAPIEPVGGRTGATKDPSKMTTDEWMRWRNEQTSARRR